MKTTMIALLFLLSFFCSCTAPMAPPLRASVRVATALGVHPDNAVCVPIEHRGVNYLRCTVWDQVSLVSVEYRLEPCPW